MMLRDPEGEGHDPKIFEV